METEKLNAHDKIVRAKVQLQTKSPFFSCLVMNMRYKEENSIPSMGVDIKGNVYYNTKWVEKISNEQVEGVLVHEIMHIILQHLQRLKGRDMHLFNCANDLVVNDIIVGESLSLPEGLVPYNHKFTFPDGIVVEKINEKPSEEIYEELRKQAKQQKQQGTGQGQGTQGFDEHYYSDGDDEKENGKGVSKEELQKLEKKWKGKLAEATQYAKQIGKMPKGMERFVDELLEGRVSWRHKLYKYITAELPFDFTWSRPSKKFTSMGIYMPSVLKEKIDMVVAIDTSGSICQEELTDFLSEICCIAKSFANISMKLLVCDCKIHNTYDIANGSISNIMELEVGGGGGTSHKPIVDWVNENKPNAKLLISLTDGYSDIENVYDELPYSCHKVIVLTKNSCPESQLEEYGEIVKLE